MSLLSWNINKRDKKYIPQNPEKFVGTYVHCRSSYEYKFAKWCDQNPSVVRWSNESIAIPYFDPYKKGKNKIRKYYPDFIIQIGDKRFVVEIKPYIQTRAPKISNRKKKSTMIREAATYDRNIRKWEAALRYCKKNNMEFKIITEKALKI